jgi:hypothetical protein
MSDSVSCGSEGQNDDATAGHLSGEATRAVAAGHRAERQRDQVHQPDRGGHRRLRHLALLVGEELFRQRAHRDHRVERGERQLRQRRVEQRVPHVVARGVAQPVGEGQCGHRRDVALLVRRLQRGARCLLRGAASVRGIRRSQVSAPG